MKTLRASHILSICDHLTLAESRELILYHAGYNVKSARSDADLAEWSDTSIELVLLCHTIGQDRLRELVRRLRQAFPEAGIIYIGQIADCRDLHVDGHCSFEDGPEGMLKSVEAVLGQAKIVPMSSA